MALFNGIKIDGTIYDVRIKYETLKRTFQIIEGRNAGLSIAYRKIRDIQGTGYSYTFEVEPNPTNRAAYDTFYQKISEPVDSHEIEMPFGQTTLSFTAYIEAGTDTYCGKVNNQIIWKGLSVTFTYLQPVRTSV